MTIVISLAGAACAVEGFSMFRGPSQRYRDGANRIAGDIERVKDDLDGGWVNRSSDADLRVAQLEIIAWSRSLPPADRGRPCTKHLNDALNFYGSAIGQWMVAREKGMKRLSAELLQESAQNEAAGDKAMTTAEQDLGQSR